MDYVAGPVQFFAVRADAVRCHTAQNEAWLWYGDSLCSWKLGCFEVHDDGWLEFVPSDEE